MIALALALLLTQGDVDHAFVYKADADLKSVSVAGTFNNWSKDANPLTANGRVWSATVRLHPGKVQYKFVLNGDKWVQDPANPKSTDDLNGGYNSYLLVLPSDYNGPAAKGDGVVATSALFHDPKSPSYLDLDNGRLWFSLRARPGDINRIVLVAGSRKRGAQTTSGEPKIFEDETRFLLSPLSSDELYELDRTGIDYEPSKPLDYVFMLEDGNTRLFLGPKGVTPTPDGNLFEIQPGSLKEFKVPRWPEQSVIYQIFPDRFENGDRSNDPKDVQPWDAKPLYFNRFGGDAAGVRKHIGYLKSLGVKAVYFNPIFQAPSNHRYDASDYYKSDPEFGTNEEVAALSRDLKHNGIRTIFDGVFNHTGTQFFAFQDLLKNQQASKYKDWYYVLSYPVKKVMPPPYLAWWGFADLPKVNQHNPDARAYFLGVPKYWDDLAHISGWRLDVPNEVQDDYWLDFRKVVKSTDPDRWIIGEIWSDGNHWLQGDMFDSIMGYQFRFSTLQFVANKAIGPTEYMNQLMGVYASYAPQVSRNLMNLISSHDTPRFLTMCKGDEKLARLGATLQLTWVGAPSVYYGDELGMEGDKDPDNRKPMRWDIANDRNSMLHFYRALIRARNGSRALQSGAPVVLSTNDSDGTLAYARVLSDDLAVVAANRSSSPRTLRLTLGQMGSRSFVDALSGKKFRATKGAVTVNLPAESAAVLVPAGGRG